MGRLTRGAAVAAVLLAALASGAGCSAPGADTTMRTPAASGSEASTASASATGTITFAVIGDHGTTNAQEAAVASLVASWEPSFVVSCGDGYYAVAGGTGTAKYDRSVGAYYGRWLKDITTSGSLLPTGPAPINAFFPALGNHDYSDATPSPRTYLTYFTLPGSDFANSSGNERYYDFVQGPVHFFILNSNRREPAGTSSTSAQAKWLKTQLAASSSSWNVVVAHHPPYSSDKKHGSVGYMRWPFAQWGADAVISGHTHDYERVLRDGVVYFVNGLGGAARRDAFGRPVAGSVVRYRADCGAQRVTATPTTLDFEFRDLNGALIDNYHLSRAPAD